MPLQFELNVLPLAPTNRCTAAELRTLAVATGNRFAGRRANVGITVPTVRAIFVNDLWDSDETTPVWGGGAPTRRGRFGQGTLRIVLHQQIHLLLDLPATDFLRWQHHEMDHVADNRRVFDTQLVPAIEADRDVYYPVFVRRDWLDAAQDMRGATLAMVERLFRELSQRAAELRDTAREYDRVMQDIHALGGRPRVHGRR